MGTRKKHANLDDYIIYTCADNLHLPNSAKQAKNDIWQRFLAFVYVYKVIFIFAIFVRLIKPLSGACIAPPPRNVESNFD